MSHTPGPWYFDPENDPLNPKKPILEIVTDDFIGVIATVNPTVDGPTEECYANGRLLAAAPSMLRALRLIKREVTEDVAGLNVDMAWGILDTILDMAEEAINTATGLDDSLNLEDKKE